MTTLISTAIDPTGIPASRMSQKTKILILADIPILRRGLAALIRDDQGLDLCGEFAESDEALNEIGNNLPDLLVSCIPLSLPHGSAFLQKLGSLHPDLPVLVLSPDESEDETGGQQALQLGARGYVPIDHTGERTIEAIRTIAGGGNAF